MANIDTAKTARSGGAASDEELKARLDRAVASYGKLNESRIRVENDLQREQAELERSRAALKERFGTDDPVEVQSMIDEARAANEAAVVAFEDVVESVTKAVAAVDRG